MELTAIPGVGKKTADALASIDGAERAIEEGDVATLARAPGISPSRAARIARAAIRARHGEEGEFLGTDRAREIYENLVDRLQRGAETEYGKRRLETLYPSTSNERIEHVQEKSKEALELGRHPEARDALACVEPLRSPRDLRIRDRCIATRDAERHERARETYPELSVEVADDARDIADLARGYATVIVLDEAFAGLDHDENVRVDLEAMADPATLVPERTLAFFAENRDTILAAIEIHRHAGLDLPEDVSALEASLDRIDADGHPTENESLQRLSRALDDLDATVAMARNVADDSLRAAIQERDVTVEGTDLLSMVERGAGVDALLSRELEDEFESAIARAREHLIDGLELTEGEATHVERIFSTEPTYPIDADEKAVERLREDLQFEHDRLATHLKEELATSLEPQRSTAHDLARRALEFDVELAIARFAREYGCSLPRFEDEGFAIEGGRSPLLDLQPDEIESVEYAVSDAVLLSGVNSGGKTSLLDLIAAITILAHMGLPVPADHVRLQRYEAIHYHASTLGTVDAGAFEATVRQFADIATTEGDRLVLVDELESITEPGAAALIVGGILEELPDEVTAVFVTHLAPEIRAATDVAIRVDGIAATGVEHGELVVNRSPRRDHLARSTPELIVEQLATREDDRRSAVYESLLAKFEQS